MRISPTLNKPRQQGVALQRFLYILLLAICSPCLRDEPISCSYQSKATRELEPTEHCGTLSADGLLILKQRIVDDMDWSKYGMSCLNVSNSQSLNGWFFVNQSGYGRSSTFLQDNDCAPYSEGLARGISQGKVVFYDQALAVVHKSDFAWAGPFHKGYAKVCKGDLYKEYDSSGEHYTYKGGACGFISRDFSIVVPVAYPYESTPEPPVQ